MLSPYRVLDCTDARGQLAGMLLAQLGADVILVEPPEGSDARHRAPYAGGGPDPERALWHWAFNRGKRSVVLDTTSEEGRRDLLLLAADVDVLLWSGRPAECPFDTGELAAVNPGLVVAITGFGLDGPKSDWIDTDLIVSAAGLQLALTGDTDRAPLRIGSPQAHLHAASDAAVAALVGLVERARSGQGQVADVSAQVSCLQASFCYGINQAWGTQSMGRSGDGVNLGGFRLRWIYPATDGEVSITLMFGAAMVEFTGNLFRWIWEEGGCDEATRDKPWADLWVQLEAGLESADEIDRLSDVIAAFIATRSKGYLFAEARRRRVLLAPVSSLGEVMDHDHLAARQFWDQATDAEGATPHRAPGRFVVASATPLRSLAPAPRLGQDTEAVLAEARARAAAPEGPAQAPAVIEAGSGQALEGLKVLDLTWSIAGPVTTRGLADFGATVVKVESRSRPDFSRTAGPFHAINEAHPLEGSGFFANSNAGKLGLEIDLSNEAGREVFWDLVRWADVVVEAFSAGAMERMGFGYDRLAEVKPGIVLLSTCLPGQTGTLDLPGYGNLTTAMFGFTATTRWPDRQPAGPFGAYTDVVSPRFGLIALLAALDHRRRTGQGQHLDLSQAEASLHFLAPALLDAEVNGHEMEAMGNHDRELAPHGVYPTVGEDQWVAVVCTDDGAWAQLAGCLGRADLADLGVEERLARRDELDELIAAWTAPQSGEVLQAVLQARGIAAHQIQNSPECLADPQLIHRGHYVTVEHHLMGPIVIEGPRFGLSRTPGSSGPSPTYGQHAQHVLSDLLGYDDDRIADLIVAGAMG